MKLFTMSFVLLATLVLSPLYGEDESEAAKEIYRYPMLHVTLESWQEDDPVQTYRKHGSGGCGVGSTTGMGVGGRGNFNVYVTTRSKDKVLKAEVKVDVGEGETFAKPQNTTVVLKQMQTAELTLAEGGGRTYRLKIRPEIVEVKQARKFDVDSLQLETFDFTQSPVILNDEHYVGQIGMSGGTLSGIEIAGVANIEFSLFPLKDAKPLGTLRDGSLFIKNGEQTVLIAGVRNGTQPKTLTGGPFKVWVRWKESKLSLSETQKQVAEQIKLLRQRQADGETNITDDVIARLQSFADSGRPMLFGSFARSVRNDELKK